MEFSMYIIFYLCLLSFLKNSFGYFITVDAYGKECFFENAAKGSKLGLTFEVTQGGFLDIDIEVRKFI